LLGADHLHLIGAKLARHFDYFVVSTPGNHPCGFKSDFNFPFPVLLSLQFSPDKMGVLQSAPCLFSLNFGFYYRLYIAVWQLKSNSKIMGKLWKSYSLRQSKAADKQLNNYAC
jgi:hypothetical protein